MKYGYVKVAAAVPNVLVGDCMANAQNIVQLVIDGEKAGVEVMVFPELSICGYTCGDLLLQSYLLKNAEKAMSVLLAKTSKCQQIFIVGMPLLYNNTSVVNAAVVCRGGEILGVVPKTFLPSYKEFYEKRWFVSGKECALKEITICDKKVPFGKDLIFNGGSFSFGVEICEDLWATVPCSSLLALNGAEIIFNLSASTEIVSKAAYCESLVAKQSAACICGYVYSSCGKGESTTDVVFAGNSYIYENGSRLAIAEKYKTHNDYIVSEIDVDAINFERRQNTTFATSAAAMTEPYRVINAASPKKNIENTITRKYSPSPFVPSGKLLDERCKDIIEIQVAGLSQRLTHINCKTVVVGISGGLDSTLALLVCVNCFDKLHYDRKGIIGITMPGFGTTDRTYNNAINLMKSLGVTIREISIAEQCRLHFKSIGHNENVHDVTYENVQARQRTEILMNVANQTGGIVIGTGDMSELALGWCTYNGDQMSMYAVNVSVPKTLVRHLVKWTALNNMDDASKATLLDVVDTPISPELIPADESGNITQKTEDLVGPYQLHDFFLYHFLRNGFTPEKIDYIAGLTFEGVYNKEVILKWLKVFFRRFFTQQFKRSCMPDGPKVGSVSLSPRGDWRMPSDASFGDLLSDITNLE